MDDGNPTWITHTHIASSLAQYVTDFPDAEWVAHNAVFDFSALAWHYDIHPKVIRDTLSMARIANFHGKHSLDALSRQYGLGEKGDALIKTLGVETLDPLLEQQLAQYCVQDVELLRRLYKRLSMDLQATLGQVRYAREMALIDLTVRMFTEPVLEVNADLLRDRLAELEAERAAALQSAGVDESVLMSNQQFASLLAAQGVDVPATFRKTDTDFLELRGDPRVGHLVRGRLAVKSVSELRRTEKFIAVAGRGTLPMPLKYHGAHTGRWSGSDGLNVQNLNRGSALRRCLQAPEGHVLVVVDSAQIEARVLAWLAGEAELLQQFADGEDVYVRFAMRIWPEQEIDATRRFVGKTCFSADTKVLTNNGVKPIIQVTGTDLVWDGDSWVKHSGIAFQGVKPTIRNFGLAATADHEILTEHGWREWSEVQSEGGLFQSALALARSSLFGMSLIGRKKAKPLDGTQSAAAIAGGKGELIGTISKQEDQQLATHAQRSNRIRRGIGNTNQCYSTMHIARGYLIDCHRASVGATIRAIQLMKAMALAGLKLLKSGAMTVRSFFAIYKPFPAGMFPNLNLTESTSTMDMSREMSDLSQNQKTLKTSDGQMTFHRGSSSLSENLPVYDLLNCGPNHRFTVMTTKGPMIVHNCILGLGYGVGHVKLHAQVVVKQPEATLDDAAGYVAVYRSTYTGIRNLWRTADRMIRAMMGTERIDWPQGIVTAFEKIRLPSGRWLHYPDLRLTGEGFEYDAKQRLYGAKLVENLVQAIARDIVADQMLVIARKYRIATMTHDEIVFLAREDEAGDAFGFAQSVMRAAPKYATGLPLSSSGGWAREYSK